MFLAQNIGDLKFKDDGEMESFAMRRLVTKLMDLSQQEIENTVPQIENTVPQIENTVPQIQNTVPKIENTVPKI